MFGKEILQQLSAYKQGMQIEDVKKKYNLKHIVKLSSNENPYGYSKLVDDIFPLKDFEIYPDGYSYELRVAMANKLHVDMDNIVFGAGSDELITCICRAFLREGTNTVMATPTFSQYRHHSLIEGAELKEIPTRNGRHQLAEMGHAIDENTKVVWLCTPDNPTGEIINKSEFAHFIEQCPKDVVVVLDAAYFEYMNEEDQFDVHEILNKHNNVIILRTFSKIYGLAGLRIGYGITSKEIAHVLNVVRGPFNTSSISQRAALAAIQDDEFVQYSKEENARTLKQFKQFLDTIHWEYYDSHTNFLLVKTPIDGDEVSLFLLKNGFIVRSGTALGYPNTVRITIGKDKDMKKLQQTILQFHNELDDNGVKE